MSDKKNPKENFLDIFNQLTYDYKNIVLNTFKCLVSYSDFPEKGYKPYDIAGLIEYHQAKLHYTNQEVCEKVNKIIDEAGGSPDDYLYSNTFQKLKARNTQTSKKGKSFLKYIAQTLKFDYEEYKKYLNP